VDPNGLKDKPPAQLHLIEQTNIDTHATNSGYSQEETIQRYTKNMAAWFHENPDDYEAGHHKDTPQWNSPPGAAQKIGPQNWLANNQQSQQEAAERAAAANAGQYVRTARKHTGPPVANPPAAQLPRAVKDIAAQDRAQLLANGRRDPVAPAPAAPASPALPSGQLELRLANPPAAPTTPPAAAPAPSAPAEPSPKPTAPSGVAAPAPAASAPSIAPKTATQAAGGWRAGAAGAVRNFARNPRTVVAGAATTAGGVLLRAFVPGAAEVTETVAAVGVRGAVRLAASAGGEGALVVGSAAVGAAVGYGIEKVYPGYTQHAANIGSRVEAATGSTVGGGIATVATVLPLVWAGTKAFDLLTGR
jgi:hypothetical protein